MCIHVASRPETRCFRIDITLYELSSTPELGLRPSRHLHLDIPADTTISCPNDTVRIFTDVQVAIHEMATEHCFLLCLNAKNRPVGMVSIAQGSLDGFLTSPREMIGAAILLNAAGAILVHNHPSHDPSPSDSDLELTRKAAQAFELCGMKLLDHIVIGTPDRYKCVL